MKIVIAAWIALVALGLSGTAHAVPPIKVWAYGDGETTRMLSELNVLNKPLITKITIESKAKKGSGPIGNPNLPGIDGQDLKYRIIADLYPLPLASYPNVIHIGYNASAASYAFCPSGLADWPEREAAAIEAAADFVADLGIKVLLSKGPGVPVPSVGAPDQSCLQGAFDRVTWYLAINAGWYPWVDYSGFTAGAGAAPLDPNLRLVKTGAHFWEADHVHVSCDIKRYFEDGVGYAGCKGVANEAERKKLGAWRVASTVLKAYKALQLLP